MKKTASRMPPDLSTNDSPERRLADAIVACRRCPRLREHCETVAREKRKSFQDWSYFGKPVPNFGDPHGKLLIVGLAPAAHGANRTGRMFTKIAVRSWLRPSLPQGRK